MPGELAVWRRMSGPDRRHAVGVARRVQRALGAEADGPVTAAALLHDAGKVDSGLGTFGRVGATLAGLATGGKRARTWAGRGGLTGRVGRYLRRAPLGADILRAAGSDPLTVAWAEEHHLPPERWTVPPAIAQVLKEADDD